MMLKWMLDVGMIDKSFYKWLRNNDFEKQPASTKYHGNYEGGLYDHSVQVTIELLNLTEKLNIKWKRNNSPYIIGMFHDLCKIDKYKFVPSYDWTYNDQEILSGHGEKSVILLSQHIELTEEEIMCIRYHMGAYVTDDWKQLDIAIKKYPNILYVHLADMIASKLKV